MKVIFALIITLVIVLIIYLGFLIYNKRKNNNEMIDHLKSDYKKIRRKK